jgi:hypothetical protein
MTDVTSFAGVALLSSAFLLAHWSRRLTLKIKRRWEALSAGVAVAYMFVGVLPELAEHQPNVSASAMGTLLSAEKRIYIWALAGFVAFAGLSQVRFEKTAGASYRPVFWAKMAGFALYVLLVGYLLVLREDHLKLFLWMYVSAMGLHIFMLDIAMAEEFGSLYGVTCRVALTAAVFLGGVLGIVDVLPASFTSRLFALILGAVTLTTAHEELRAEEAMRFWWFTCGAAAYATILLLV